jgi:neurofibromin 1
MWLLGIFLLYLQFVTVLSSQRPHGPDLDKNYYESLFLVLDTLEKCLSGQPKDTTRYDEAMNVKLLLREVCQFIGTYTSA